MNKENTEYLITTFPNLYQGYKLGPKESLMCFGFECDDGWFELIKKLSEKLEPMGAVAVQVKEKYGTLRFYAHNTTEEALDLIEEAEDKTEKICEKCGSPGKLRKGGWLRTLCDSCQDSRWVSESSCYDL